MKLKTVFDQTTRDELTARISTLSENSTAQWGKMNVYQMLKHCTLWEEWIFAKTINKQSFIGRLFGRMALKSMMKDEKQIGKNSPTIPEFKIKETKGDVAAEKAKWISLIAQYEHYTNNDFVHTFFGKMTQNEIGIMAYKHADHHLRQFSA
jgi:hypothetical protein